MSVIVNIIGGLGNQMFQYAAGLVLAKKNNLDLLLDLHMFNDYGLHNGFELSNVFMLNSRIADFEDIRKVIGWRSIGSVRGLMRSKYFSWLKGPDFLIDREVGLKILNLNICKCYLMGYWQSEQFFLDYKDAIREKFLFRKKMLGKNAQIADLIRSSGSAISLHVRRGDYVSNKKTFEAHGVCEEGYYNEAMKLIDCQVSNPVYFVFSDDICWAKKKLFFSGEHYFIDHNVGIESYNDMRLMSLCDHHIIANSTFSWWGAWLNPSDNKIVIAPKKWFANNTDSYMMVPEKWFRI